MRSTESECDDAAGVGAETDTGGAVAETGDVDGACVRSRFGCLDGRGFAGCNFARFGRAPHEGPAKEGSSGESETRGLPVPGPGLGVRGGGEGAFVIDGGLEGTEGGLD